MSTAATESSPTKTTKTTKAAKGATGAKGAKAKSARRAVTAKTVKTAKAGQPVKAAQRAKSPTAAARATRTKSANPAKSGRPATGHPKPAQSRRHGAVPARTAESAPQRGPRAHAAERVEIKPRNVRFDLSKTPLHWIPGEPIASHAISTFNYMLPVGERWFCQIYERLLPFVQDETLRREMLGFMGQEGIHAQTHDEVLREFLVAHGITNAERFADLVEWVEDRFYPLLDQLSDDMLVQVLKPQLALIAVIEQLTAFMGTWSTLR